MITHLFKSSSCFLINITHGFNYIKTQTIKTLIIVFIGYIVIIYDTDNTSLLKGFIY